MLPFTQTCGGAIQIASKRTVQHELVTSESNPVVDRLTLPQAPTRLPGGVRNAETQSSSDDGDTNDASGSNRTRSLNSLRLRKRERRAKPDSSNNSDSDSPGSPTIPARKTGYLLIVFVVSFNN